MGQKLLVNVSVFDGSGSPLFPGEVLVQGNRIKAVAKGRNQLKADGAEIVDGGGATLMPGLTEAHAHLSFTNCASVLEMGDLPIEEHTLYCAARKALARLWLHKLLLRRFGKASARHRHPKRNECRLLPGPRLRAASPEITASGGLGDVRQLHKDHHSTEIIADGPDELRRVVRTMVREGVDTIKINLSGDNWVRPGFSETVTYTDAEVAAAAGQAKELGVKLACHSHATRAIKLALKYDFDVLYHCEYADEEALDQSKFKKDTIFVAPTIGSSWAYTYEAERWGITKEIAERNGMLVTIERACDVYRKMRKRGIRALPGGDYGFAWNPNRQQRSRP